MALSSHTRHVSSLNITNTQIDFLTFLTDFFAPTFTLETHAWCYFLDNKIQKSLPTWPQPNHDPKSKVSTIYQHTWMTPVWHHTWYSFSSALSWQDARGWWLVCVGPPMLHMTISGAVSRVPPGQHTPAQSPVRRHTERRWASGVTELRRVLQC